MENKVPTGYFRVKESFTQVTNCITRDNTISLKAKGLYLVIQSCITNPNKRYSKEDFYDMTAEGLKAFESAWKELKDKGYLKVHNFPNGGNFSIEFELLDRPELGAHTFYYNKEGEVTKTNLEHCQDRKQRVPHNGVPANGGSGKRVDPKGVPAKGVPAEGVPGNGGSINNTDNNTIINTDNNTNSFILSENNRENEQKECDYAIMINPDERILQGDIDMVLSEISDGIPVLLKEEPQMMKKTIQVLADWNNREETYKFSKSEEMVYLQLMECLVEMTVSRTDGIYKGVQVCADDVISAIDRYCRIERRYEGALYFFMQSLMWKANSALHAKPVANIKGYLKAMIWEQLTTYQVQEAVELF